MGEAFRFHSAVFFALVFGVFVFPCFSQSPEGLPAGIALSGNIEARDAEISFKIPGRIKERFVSEGDPVTAGQPVATLDDGEIQAEKAVREAELILTQAALRDLEAGSRPEEIAQAEAVARRLNAQVDELTAGSRPREIEAAQAGAERARADFELAQKEFERAENLHRRQIVTDRDLDKAAATLKAARARHEETTAGLRLVREGPRAERIAQARGALAEAEARLELIRKGPRKETLDQARARVAVASQALSLVLTRLGETVTLSPISGFVVSENLERGEFASPGTPVVTVAHLDRVWLRGYVHETDLGKVRLGQEVRVSTDSFPGKNYAGRVSFISSQAEFTPKVVQTSKERVRLVFRIKVDIPNPNQELKPGMPADAFILLP